MTDAKELEDKKILGPGGFNVKLPAADFPARYQVSSHVVFVKDTTFVCGSNVGLSGGKWCAVERKVCEKTGPRSHQGSNEFEELQAGLYIRAPTTDPDKVHAYTEPVIPLGKLTPKILYDFLEFVGERSPTEWRQEFSTFLDSDPDEDEEGRKERITAISRMRNAVTPAPSKHRNQRMLLENLLDNMEDFKVFSSEDKESLAVGDADALLSRLVLELENAFTGMVTKLPEEMKKVFLLHDELMQRLDTLTALVKRVEAGIGRPSRGFEKVAHPTLWGAVSALSGDVNAISEDTEDLGRKIDTGNNEKVQEKVEKVSELLGTAAQALKSQKGIILRLSERVTALESGSWAVGEATHGPSAKDNDLREEMSGIKMSVSKMEAALASHGGWMPPRRLTSASHSE